MKAFKLSVGLFCAATLGLSSPVYATITVTWVIGSVATGGRTLDRPGELADDGLIATGEDGAASIFAEDLLVELCSSSSLMVQEEEGRQIVRVDSGNVRLLVDPTASRVAPMQIHTPLAIATVLGTEVYVSVDPATGATTFTSADHPVRIDLLDGSSVTIEGGEQMTVLSGEAAGAPVKLASAPMSDLGSCLADFHSSLRTMSLNLIRMERMAQTFNTVTLPDTVPPVAAPPPGPAQIARISGPPPDPLEGDHGPSPVDDFSNSSKETNSGSGGGGGTIFFPPPPPMEQPLPPCSDGFPNEGCSF